MMRKCDMHIKFKTIHVMRKRDMRIKFGLAVDTKLVWAGINGGER